MTKLFGYLGHSDDITDKRHFNRQYKNIKDFAAKNKMGRIQFVAEFDPERVSRQKEELRHLLSSRIQSGDILITELPILGNSMLEIVAVLSSLVQKGVTVYWIQNGELVWKVDTKVMSFIQFVIAEIHENEGSTPKDSQGNEGAVNARML